MDAHEALKLLVRRVEMSGEWNGQAREAMDAITAALDEDAAFQRGYEEGYRNGAQTAAMED